jgi:hypothetical protein
MKFIFCKKYLPIHMAPSSGYTKRNSIKRIGKIDGQDDCQVEININAMIP